MSLVFGSGAKVYLNGFDLSAFFKSAKPSLTAEAKEVTVFGALAKTYLPALKESTWTFEGYYDGSVEAVDQVLQAALAQAAAAGAQSVVTLSPQGDGAGHVALGAQGVAVTYDIDEPADGVAAISADIQSAVGWDALKVLLALTPETTTGQGMILDDGAATSNGGAAYLHVTALSGITGLSVAIQHSSDTVTWPTLATFAAMTAANVAQRLVVTAGTTVDRYLRASWTFMGTGYATFWVGFGRRF